MPYSPGKKYRGYSQENLAKAFKAVKEKNTPVQRAAREYGVPESTLRDRIKGKVGLQKTRSGPAPVLGMKEENKLVEYLQLLTDFGYSFSRADVINLATDFAVVLGKRDPSDTFTHQWYYSFMSRWPGLVSRRLAGARSHSSKATTIEALTTYYHQLQSTLKKYNLTKSPDSLFVIEEVCINTDKSPPEVISWKDVRCDKNNKVIGPTLTMIVCGNSTGARLPGFFVFPGKTVSSESIEDCSPGTGATCSDEGTTNSSVFQLYLENHFLKFIERKEEAQPILLLYDGHRTHISPAMIELYKKQYVHMFPLPPNVSQATADMSFGIFKDFVPRFNEESDDFLESELDKSIHSSVCVVACKAYKRAINSTVLKAFFKNVGIYPFCPTEMDSRIDLSKPVLFPKRNIPVKKPKETIAVKWQSPRHQVRRKVVKPRQEISDQDDDDFEDMESEAFGGKTKKRKKEKTVYRYNYSNRRKSTTPKVKKQKVEPALPSTSYRAPPTMRLKVKKQKKEKEKKSKRGRRSRKRDSSTEESSEYESESTDSEIDEMLSSDEHDIDDYEAQTSRLQFESSLREELETSRLYFEYNQKKFKLVDSPVKEHSYEMLVHEQPGHSQAVQEQHETADQYPYQTVMTVQIDESGNIINTSRVEQQIVEEQVVEDQVVEEQIESISNEQEGADQQVDQQQQDNVEQQEEAVAESEEKEGKAGKKSVKQEPHGVIPAVVETVVEEEVPMQEVCCVCKQYHPEKAVAGGYIIEFATWGKCDYPECEHWTHLKYCCDVKALRRHDIFHCPCHQEDE